MVVLGLQQHQGVLAALELLCVHFILLKLVGQPRFQMQFPLCGQIVDLLEANAERADVFRGNFKAKFRLLLEEALP